MTHRATYFASRFLTGRRSSQPPPLKSSGFTIVELLIVIVIIAILAALVIVAYVNMQQRARDTQRRSDLTNLAKAMQGWSVENNQLPTAIGGGYNNTGAGWVSFGDGGAFYATSITQKLTSAGYRVDKIHDPLVPITTQNGYMHYRCSSARPNTFGFFAKLEVPTSADQAIVDKWLSDGCYNAVIGGTYNMNYVKSYEVPS